MKRKFRIIKKTRRTSFGPFDGYVIQKQKNFSGRLIWDDLELDEKKYYNSLEAAESALTNYIEPPKPSFEVIKEYEF